MLVLLLLAFIAVLAWVGWHSRREPYIPGRCCSGGAWPPDDLTEPPPDA